MVHTGVPASSSAWMLASSSGPPCARQVEPNAAISACLPRHVARALEELGVLRVRARPAALDEGDAELVEPLRDAQLVVAESEMPSRWVPSRSVVS